MCFCTINYNNLSKIIIRTFIKIGEKLLKKNICRILILNIFIILAIFTCGKNVYGVAKTDLGDEIPLFEDWNSLQYNYTDENRANAKNRILTALRETVGYEGSTINEYMKFDTTIEIVSIETDSKTREPLSYTIKIRK